MNSEHDPATRLIVDVGCGQFPFPMRHGGRQIGPGEEYRGYDLFERQYLGPESVNILLQQMLDRSGGTGHVERADATSLPLDEGTADEVIMINLLSSPRVDRSAIVREVGRILKRPSGIVTVVDTYAPAHYPVQKVREVMRPAGLKQLNWGQESSLADIRKYSDARTYRKSYIAMFGFPPNDVTNTSPRRLHSGADCHSIDTSEKGGKTLMAETAQQQYHGKVRQVQEGVNSEKTAMGAAKQEATTSKERIAGVQEKWATFVTALASTRSAHTEFLGSLGSAAGHHREKVVPAQAVVDTKQAETVGLYQTLISDIRHPAIQQFAQILGAMGESVKDENTIVAGLTQNYTMMEADAARREDALGQLQVAGHAYKENRLDPQQANIAATPDHYDAQMGAASQGHSALQTYISTT
jgi:hypothetical protein